MDLSTVFSAVAALAAVVSACAALATLKPAQRAWLQDVSKTWTSRVIFVAVICFSLLMIGTFWISDAPITRGSIVVLLMSAFNVVAWSGLALLSAVEKRTSARQAGARGLEANVAALSARIEHLERSRTVTGG